MPISLGTSTYMDMLAVSLLTMVLALPALVNAQSDDIPREKIGLVLSGGGARGAAHVGVIKVLDEMRIPIDFIVGTSMGAIVGGLYASGLDAAELENILVEADWATLLSDRPSRARRPYRRKTDDFGFLVNFDVGVRKEGLILPQGIVQGQNFTLALRRWLLPVATTRDFDRLPIPFRAVATDIASGEEVVLGSGDLATAIRASMSAPGVFKPVRMNDRILVDGGIADNLPVGIARSMGADVLIVVDVGFPLAQEDELNSALKITNQMLTILIRARTEDQKRLMTSNDVLISPELGLIGSQAFDRSPEAMRLGEISARESMDTLERFSLSKVAYAAHRQSQRQESTSNPVITRIAIENESNLSPELVQRRLVGQSGVKLDVDELESGLTDIYGSDSFETLDYSISRDGTDNELLISGNPKSWGPNYLRFGVNLEDDFNGNSTYNLAARFTKLDLNRRGGEFRADVVLGESPQLAAEFYQPLDYGSRWFVNPAISIARENQGLFANGNQLAELRSKESLASLSAGRVFGNWGELRLTIARSFGEEEVRVGDPAIGSSSGYLTTFSAGLGYDTIDRLAIPRQGTNLQFVWSGLREGAGADLDVDVGQVFLLKPQTWGKNTLLHWWDFSSVERSGDAPLNAFRLGGLFNISGSAPDEFRGDHRAVGRLLYYRRLGDRSASLFDTPMYVGASLEVGNVWSNRSDVSFDDTLIGGSVFVIFDTIVGPLYLAYGAAEGDRRSAYLFLGQTF